MIRELERDYTLDLYVTTSTACSIVNYPRKRSVSTEIHEIIIPVFLFSARGSHLYASFRWTRFWIVVQFGRSANLHSQLSSFLREKKAQCPPLETGIVTRYVEILRNTNASRGNHSNAGHVARLTSTGSSLTLDSSSVIRN